jgi:hypothetical protein
MSRLGSFKSWIILILVISFLSPAISAIFDFLGIDKSSYESYILWGNALIVFWFVLDEERSKDLLFMK